jgi:hypothetical protein
MAAPIPSPLAFKTAGVDSLQSNLANWVLQSDGVTPALRTPVAGDNVAYLTQPTDSLSGFNFDLNNVIISGQGTVMIQNNSAGGNVTLVAGGSSLLFLAGATAGQDLSLVGTDSTHRILFGGFYNENGDGSGNIQNTNFSGDLDVETVGGVSYDSIKCQNFATDQGGCTITNIEVFGTSNVDVQSATVAAISGIFHGLATQTYAAYAINASSVLTGMFLGGQAVSGLPSIGTGTLYDQQYVDLQVDSNDGLNFDPAHP